MYKFCLVFTLLFITTTSFSQYFVNQVPYVLEPTNGTLINLTDDDISPQTQIGFNFCFWGNTYSRCYIGSNGWVGFSGGQPTAFTPFAIPTLNAFTPKNAIFSPFHDLNTGIAGFPATPITYVYFYTTGVAPFRRFVVSWVNVPMYQCTAIRSSQQIVLYETTNLIRTNITKKSTCLIWVNGRATHGLHNINGTQAVVVPNRNASVWNINPLGETWEFIPDFCCSIFDDEIIIN